MSDITTLQYLVDLIDDDSEEVRNEIIKELVNYGLELEEDLQEFSNLLTEDKLKFIEPVLEENRRQWFFDNWDLWKAKTDQYESLEEAMRLVVNFQEGIGSQDKLSILLYELSEDFMNKFPYGDEFDLANYLFREKGITGSKLNYYNPLNSNLKHAIEQKEGLPITLSILYMLVGVRAGLFIEGCNFPGHFLAKIHHDKEIILVDCFNNGRMIYQSELHRMVKESYEAIMRIIENGASTPTIVKRILNNLANAYKQSGDKANSDFFLNLIKTTTW